VPVTFQAVVKLGSSTIGVAVGTFEKSILNVQAHCILPARGIHQGAVVHMEDAMQTLKVALKEVRQTVKQPLKKVLLVVHHKDTMVQSVTGSITLKGQTVTAVDVARTLDAAKATGWPEAYDLLHFGVQSFTLDGVSGINNPIGMSGHKMTVHAYLMLCHKQVAANLLRCVRGCGLEVTHCLLKPLAASVYDLTEDERQLGVGWVHIGATLTTVAIFFKRELIDMVTLPIGGYHITADIASLYQLSLNDAEILKQRYGTDASQRQSLHGGVSLEDVIMARCEEIVEWVGKVVKQCYVAQHASCGFVISGGSSQLMGLPELIASRLGVMVRVSQAPVLAAMLGALQLPMQSTHHRSWYRLQQWLKFFMIGNF
jgi:cell division protein FtsA